MPQSKHTFTKIGKFLALSLVATATIFQSTNTTAATTVIRDNGGSGTSASGSWLVSGGANPYGSNSLYSKQSGDSYTYKINLASAGEYQVFARWTEWSNRRTSVPYVISHQGGTNTVNVNQQKNGGKWIKLGSTWNFGSTAVVTIRSLGNGTTNADAIKLVPVGVNISPTVTPPGSKSVAAGQTLKFTVTATDADGSAPVLSASNLPSGASFIDSNNGTGTFSWNTVSSDAGTYNVTFTATDTSNPTLTGKATANISVIGGGSSSQIIIDNGKSGTSSSGTWATSGGANSYGSKSLYSNKNGATYTFKTNLPAPGNYKVFARWTYWNNRRSSVPYVITHSNGTSTVNVNQLNNGGQWNQLGSTWSFGSNATVTIRSLGGGTTSADAIMLVPASGSSGSGGSTGGSNGGGSSAGGPLVLKVDFENRAANSTYTEAQLIQDFNANTQDGAIHGPDYGNTRIVNDPAGNTGRGKVLRARHKAGSFGNAVSFKARFAPDNANKSGSARFDDAYFAYDIYLSPNTKRMPYHKLPGMITGTMKEASHEGAWYDPKAHPDPEGIISFTAIMQSFTTLVHPSRGNGALSLNYYDANSIQKSDWLDKFHPASEHAADSYDMPLGKWITIEQRVKLNTADSSDTHNSSKDLANGLAEVWINGVKMSSKTHLWRYTNTMKIDGFWFYDFYNNRPDLISPPSVDQYVYYDNMRVSTSPITH